MSTLDPRCEAWLERQLARTKPLSETQQDIIAAAMHGALKKPPPPNVVATPVQRPPGELALGAVGADASPPLGQTMSTEGCDADDEHPIPNSTGNRPVEKGGVPNES
ncbi:MAG: hypothetical protein QOC62_1777 [Mycobacterium sp.]|nr:hypothetical protein [Mycobacterium sp.]